MKNSKISAVIFDMDGLIIDSEPLWKIAEIETFKEIGFDFTIEMCAITTGMRIDEVVEFWRKKLKWQKFSNNEIVDTIQNKMVQLILQRGKLLPGIIEALNLLKANDVLIALASSSSMSLINATVDTLKIREFFNIIHSAENEIAGKPNPAVFLSTAKMLEVQPNKCLVLEDSKAGMNAGLNANMRTVVIPEFGTSPKWAYNAFKKLKSMLEFNLDLLK
ncbi:hexitol phosphatase HxpB [Bacteroidota bacterium]|nr:hexitol phosphatase HxpB [Bacteroidota bacterium]